MRRTRLTSSCLSTTPTRIREMKVLREKRGPTGDVLTLNAVHIPPGKHPSLDWFRVTFRVTLLHVSSIAYVGIEKVLLSEDFYVTGRFDASTDHGVVFGAPTGSGLRESDYLFRLGFQLPVLWLWFGPRAWPGSARLPGCQTPIVWKATSSPYQTPMTGGAC